MRLSRAGWLGALAAVLVTAAPAAGAPAPSAGRPWAPRAMPPKLFGIAAPTASNGQSTRIEAADGTDLYIEWWLPVAKAGNTPPARLPVVAVLSPYLAQGSPGEQDTMDNVVSRGYAFATFHVRGTGLSGGCQEQFSSNEADDAARAIEFLGTAPFSDGRVGTTGLSYPGITQVAVAGRGDPAKVRYLKAVVAGGVATAQYDYNFFDGVPFFAQALAHTASYNGLNSLPSEGTQLYPGERVSCFPSVFAGSADSSGDMTPFWQDRDMRPGASRTTAAALIYHGHRDEIDRELALAGWFDRLPAATPKALVSGTWAHAYPDDVRGQTPWPRADWEAMKLQWFDRWVKGDLSADTSSWPVAQIQDETGQWRAEADWPRTAAPNGVLALGAGGVLGAGAPSGETQFVEGAQTENPQSRQPAGASAGSVAFATPPLAAPLHVTGQPVLDAWVVLDKPDAHIAARLETLEPSGAATLYGEAMGFRSLRHIDPLVGGRFAQTAGKPAPVGVPVRVQLRFDPASLVVPRGGRLRLTVSGSLAANSLSPSQPSGAMATVRILHDCAHPTRLRFQTVGETPDLIDVREEGETARPAAPAQPGPSDGGGLASQATCGEEVNPRAAPLAPAVATSDREAPHVRVKLVRRGRRHAMHVTLSEPASLRMTMLRGRRLIGVARSRRSRAGTWTVRISPGFGGRRLRSGRHRFALRATDAAGNRSRVVIVRFRVAARRR